MITVTNRNFIPEKKLAAPNSVIDPSVDLPIDKVNRSHVTTSQAAFYLNRKPQTLRTWACFEHGLIKPIRVNGRLAWPVAEIKRILNLPV